MKPNSMRYLEKKNLNPELLLDSEVIVPMQRQLEPQADEQEQEQENEPECTPKNVLNAFDVSKNTPRRNRSVTNKNSALQLLRQDKRIFYEQYLKWQSEKLNLEKEKLEAKN
ncbi:hypothetical protein NQ315_003203 [Exocentrus adspersus]|uniref:Uncharacterized protein n=1 Tax=Exocentrus adspersus TaxID=1586481 RepID=A0AAV8VN90_9CUCU|nr:hypothetical protein NQ315_003203 [Exocentrus adspersus]